MTTPAVCGYTSQTIHSFVTTVARRYPYRIFPVLDLNGRLTGPVSLTRLGGIPAADRDRLRLGDVQTPLDRVRVLDPATPLLDAAPALLAGGHRPAPVATGELLTGARLAGIDWVIAAFHSCRTGKAVIVESAGLGPGDAGLVYVQITPPAGSGSTFVNTLLAGVRVRS